MKLAPQKCEILKNKVKCDKGDEINTKVRYDQYSFIKPSKIYLKYKTIV